PPCHARYFPHDVIPFEQGAWGAIERCDPRVEPGHVRGVPRLQRCDQFGQDLRRTNNGIVDLASLDARLLGIGVTLLLHDLVYLRRQGSRVPHHQLRLPCGVCPPYQPPRRRRGQQHRRPGLSENLASCPHGRVPSCKRCARGERPAAFIPSTLPSLCPPAPVPLARSSDATSTAPPGAAAPPPPRRSYLNRRAQGMARACSSASACSSQYVIPISRYIVVAVVRCSCACSRLPLRREGVPRPRWQWATRGRMPSSLASASDSW